MDRQLKARATFPVQRLPFVNENAYGDKLYADPEALFCYKQDKISVIKGYLGEDVTSTFILMIDGILDLSTKDKFQIADVKYPMKFHSHFGPLGSNPGTTVVYL